jgi:hypothetical protein
LAGRIDGPDQARFDVGRGVAVVLRDREARQFDGYADAFLIDIRNAREAVTDHDLSRSA